MNPPRILFINKTAASESLSHSDGKAGAKIYSHVQRNRRWKNSDHGIIHARRLVKLQPQHRQTPLKRDEDCGRSAEADQGVGDGSGDQSSNRIGSVHVADGNGSTSTQEPPLASQHLGSLGPRDLSTIIKMPQSAQDIIDPFNTTCIIVDGTVHTLLQYYLHIVHPSVWHILSAGSNGTVGVFKDKAMGILQGCLSEKYDMYCLLASMNVHMRYLDGYESGKDNDFFMIKALKASKDYMQRAKRINEQMIFNVFQLGFAEWYRNNQHAALVHFRATTNMTNSIGGLKAIAKPVADLLVLGDGYIAGELGKMPIFSHTQFAREDDPEMAVYVRQTHQKLRSGSVSVAIGLLEEDRKEIVPANLELIITDLAVAVLIMNAADVGGTPQILANKPLPWIYHRVLVVRHRLLEVRFEEPRAESIKLAILLWILQCFTRAGRIRSTKIIAPQLRRVLQETSEDAWKGHNEVRIWILVLGATSARVGSGDHAWFVQRILHSLGRSVDELAVKNELVDICSKFFYRELLQDDLLEMLARDIVSMRRKAEMTSTPHQKPA